MATAFFERRHDDNAPPPLLRSRFFDLWDHLPSLTVLAALPGWGRTTWMQQCASRLEPTHVRHLTWRSALEGLLTEPPTHTPQVTFVDDVLTAADDPLWPRILNHALKHPQHRFVVSSIDTPELPTRAGIVILDKARAAAGDPDVRGRHRQRDQRPGLRLDVRVVARDPQR